jgi:hypothetical protein
MDDDKSDDIDASFSCVDCGQEFGSREQLEEHETKHQNLLRTDKPTTTDVIDNPMYSIE